MNSSSREGEGRIHPLRRIGQSVITVAHSISEAVAGSKETVGAQILDRRMTRGEFIDGIVVGISIAALSKLSTPQAVQAQALFQAPVLLHSGQQQVIELNVQEHVKEPENPAPPANGRMSIPWGPFVWNSKSRYSIFDPNGFLEKLYQLSIALGLPSPYPRDSIRQYMKDNGMADCLGENLPEDLKTCPGLFEAGLCPGVPRAASLSPLIDKPITIAGTRFDVFERRCVTLYRYFASGIRRDANGQPVDYGMSANPFTASEFHYLNMALLEKGIPYGLNTKEVTDRQPWWRPAYNTVLENQGNLWRGWVEVADYMYPGQRGDLRTLVREFEYLLDPQNPADIGQWIRRDRIWAGFQVDPDLAQVSSQHRWQRESFNMIAAELVIGTRVLSPWLAYLYS